MIKPIKDAYEAALQAMVDEGLIRPAASNGLRTAHVARPGENGPGTGESAPRVPVDFAVKSMEDLATQLGV